MKAMLLLMIFLCLGAKAQDTRPVGTFGGFINKEGKTEIPQSNGFLSFAADTNLSEHQLLWKRFDEGGKDRPIATVKFPGQNHRGKLIFRDWSTLEVEGSTASALLSRTFPAVRYRTSGTGFTLEGSFKQLAVVLNGKITHFDLRRLTSIDLRAMSEPWMLLWSGEGKFDVPLYLTFESRPRTIYPATNGASFLFSTTAGAINLMPLRGVMRLNPNETQSWNSSLPTKVIFEVRAWVQKLAAFPVALKESFSIDPETKRVTIKDSYSFEFIQDAWGTVPTPIAPLPPVVVRAGEKGYPVSYPEQRPRVSDYATFYGPFAYQTGESSTYALPLANALERLPVALRVKNSPEVQPVREELEAILANKMPKGPSNFYVQNDDIASALMCDAYPTVEDQNLRAQMYERVHLLFEGSFAEDRVPRSTEPVTGQHYRSPGKHQYEHTPFDREWYTGRKLAAMARCAESLDLELARKNWDKIKDLYSYSQIFFDWVTGSVTSSVFGFNQLADGIHFNWEGVLGVARLARHLGDKKTYEDAAYRASRQQLALFAIWQQAEWSKAIDYGIAHFSVQRLPNHKIETRGAMDAWVEDFGSATLEFESHWQTANFLYFDNGAQYSLYRDFGIIEKIRVIELEIMPKMQPHWRDGNAKDPIDKKFYGSGETIAHLLARAVLFHEDPKELYEIYQGYQGTEVSRQWYTPYFYGNAGPLLLGIERSRAPVLEAPISGLQVLGSAFDAARGEVQLRYLCREDGELEFRLTPIGQESRTERIRCVRHETGTFATLI